MQPPFQDNDSDPRSRDRSKGSSPTRAISSQLAETDSLDHESSLLSARSGLIFIISLIGIGLGLLSIGDFESGILLIFFVTTYSALIFAFRWSISIYQDRFNLLVLFIIFGLVRLHIPAIIGRYDDPDVKIFFQLGISAGDWTNGHILGLIGTLSIITGWMISPIIFTSFIRSLLSLLQIGRSSKHLIWVSLAGTAIGIAGVLSFIQVNGLSILSAAQSGAFRNTEIQEGTGPLFWVGLIAIGCSSMLAAGLLQNKRSLIIAMLPVAIVVASFWILGGRFRAMTPLISAALIVVYHRRMSTYNIRVIFGLFALVSIAVPYSFYAGSLYRNGLGISAFQAAANIPLLIEYTSSALSREIGQTFSLAAVVRLEQGALAGQTFNAFLWPISDLFGIAGKSSGKYIVQSLIGTDSFGVHPTFIGDIYLNYGVLFIPILLATYGSVLRGLYVTFRAGYMPLPMYAVIAIYSLRIYYESIEKYKEFLVIFAFMLLFYKLGQYIRPSGRT